MNPIPLFEAPLAIQIHVASVVPAALLGPWLFVSRKGTPLHRLLGKIWLVLMVIAALSSFFIHAIDMFMGFSPIHLISVFVLLGAYKAYSSARNHMIRDHKRQVVSIYLGGIVGAGIFTLLPGRIMNDVLLGGMSLKGPFDAAHLASLAVVVAIFGLFAYLALREMPRRGPPADMIRNG